MSRWYLWAMEMVRTSLRLKKQLKKTAERKALEQNTTLQEIFNEALALYLKRIDEQKAKSLIFHDKAIDKQLDNLTRDDIYPNPK